MKKTLGIAEVLFTIFYIILYTGGPLYLLLSNGYSEGQDSIYLGELIPEFDFSLVRDFFLLNYVAVAFLLLLRWRRVLQTIWQSPIIWAFIFFASLSTLWSVEPGVTFNRSIALIGTTLFGLYLGSRYTLRQQCHIIAISFGLIMLSSIAFVALLPHYGISGGAHMGAWRGIYQHKNNLGNLMAVATFLFLLLCQDACGFWNKLIFASGGLCSSILLLLSQSATGLVTVVVVVVSLPIWSLLKLRLKSFVATILLGLCLALFSLFLLLSNIPTLVAWLGKDITLTGRTEIWAITWELIKRRPWSGYGFSGFWESGWGHPVAEIWRSVAWQTSSAHNSFLDVWVQLGFIGLSLFLATAISVAWRALCSARNTPSALNFWPLALLTYLSVSSLVESTIPVENDFFWVLYSTLIFTLKVNRFGGLDRGAMKAQVVGESLRLHPPLRQRNGISLLRYASNPFGNASHDFWNAENHFQSGISARDFGESGVVQEFRQTPSDLAGSITDWNRKARGIQHSRINDDESMSIGLDHSLNKPLISLEKDSNTRKRRKESNLFNYLSLQRARYLGLSALLLLHSSVLSGYIQIRYSGRLFKVYLQQNIFGFLSDFFNRFDLASQVLVELISRILRVVIQAAYFILLTRILSVQEYGIFTSISATIGLVVPFATIGAEHLIIRNLSRNQKKFATFFGNAIFISSVASTILTILVVFAAHLLFSEVVSRTFILFIALSDLFFLKLIEIGQNIFLTLNLSFKAAFLNILMSLKNLLAILVFAVAFSTQTLEDWALCYCLSTVVGAIVAFFICTLTLGFPRFSAQNPWGDLKEGLYFSIGIAAHNINSNIDKTMLLKWSTAGEAGTYAAAYRIITIALTPMFSLMAISYSKFFASGESGLKGSLKFASKLFPVAAGYGVISTVLLAMAAPLIVLLFGSDYANCVEAVRWLSPLLMIHSVKFLIEDSLAGAGLQRTRSLLQIGAACFNILLNLWLLPLYSWRRAAWSSLASELVLIIALLYCVRRYYCLEESARVSP